MAIKVLELHHHGIRVGPDPGRDEEGARLLPGRARAQPDPGRPHIPSIDGYWMDVGGTAQIHLMGVDGQSKFAKGPGAGSVLASCRPGRGGHPGTRKELDRLGVDTGSPRAWWDRSPSRSSCTIPSAT